MSTAKEPPDRATVLASLRDYIAQIREEGMEGLPATAALQPASGDPGGPKRQAAAHGAGTTSRALTAPGRFSRKSAAAVAPLLPAASYRYPGLEKTADLAALREFIGECDRCKLAPMRANLVFGEGEAHADLMFVGEAPGADEDLSGEPFVGRAGQLLTDIIERAMGMTRAQVYICNVIKCRPPENRNPELDEVAACEPFLFRQIDLVRPKVIVALGTFAVQALLKVKTPIGKLRGVWHEVRGVRMMPTFHPAYLLRNPADKRLVWADIREVMKALGRPVPQRSPRR